MSGRRRQGLALGEPTRDGFAVALASRERYGAARADVEAVLRTRLAVRPTTDVTLGRRRGDVL